MRRHCTLLALAALQLTALPGTLAVWAQTNEAPPGPSVLVLDGSKKNGAVSLAGATLAIRKGDLVVNSSHKSGLSLSNATLRLLDGNIRVVGGMRSYDDCTVTPAPQFSAEAVADPLEPIAWPELGEVRSTGKLSVAHQELTLSPGIYTGGLTIAGDATVHLEPGLYAIVDGDLVAIDCHLDGTGVTIAICGNNPGKVLFGNHSTVSLSAPADGPLKDLLIASGGSVEGSKSDLAFSDGTQLLRGTVYIPKGRVLATYKARATVGRILCFTLQVGSEAFLDVVGAGVGDEVWKDLKPLAPPADTPQTPNQ